MSIETYGTGLRLRAAARLAGKRCPNARLVLLPVPTTKDKTNVTGTDISLEDTLASAARGCLFVGYGMPQWYTEKLAELGADFYDLSGDEEYLRENAYITALGTLGYILATEKRCPADIKFGIIGYGRIGSALLRMLLFFGARVKIFTSRNLTRLELGECGICSSPPPEICVGACSFDGIDLLINTAPKDMKDYFPEGKLPSGMRLLELASGDNFKGVEGVEALPALPERMFPESAGAAYFNAIDRLFSARAKGGEKG